MQPRVLGGRYELTSLIATGGMGQVWQARDRVLSRDVAVKLLRSEYTGDPTFLARFRAEAQLAAGLVHPNIATLFDYGEVPPAGPGEEHLAYLVMELVRGESLSGLLRREGRLPADRTLEVLRQSAAGLAAAHAAGVVHRDVKPGNVLLGADGTIKITDFGVAVSGASVPLTQTGQVIGTPHYLSPEQAQGARATPASDVYALGLIGYECLAGHRAFDADSSVQVALMQIRDTPPPLPGDVPPPVRAFIDATLVKDPAARFPDGAAVVAAIDAVRAGRPLPLPAGDDRTTVLPADDDRTTVLPPAAAQTSVLPAVGTAAGAAARPMPPLRLPPEAETGARASGAPADRPARRWRQVLLPLIAVLVLAGLVFGGLQLAGSDGDEPTADTSTSPSSTGPSSTPSATAEQVTISSSDYEGRPYTDVQADLTALDLQVALRPVTTGDADDGDVLSVSPDGRLTAGSTVTVSYAVAPAATPTPSRQPVPVPSVTPDSGGEGNEDEPDEDEPDEDEGGGNGSEGGGNGSEGGGNGNSGGNGNGNGGGNGQGNGNG
ncbi:protein kinase domain-containing protein [Modestobacter italicus]|uniref:protein kinase domain-containing protein n=1 Tax=Modestobacter italicus (strain DSM 44449 / CECT 9708 / BC 501) TaxID=2732864 RepID=UPI0027DF7A80|nr:protein kinase [Modestobacter italicus]